MSEMSELQIDPGHFRLEGAVGRCMMAELEAGRAVLADHPARDYWGGVIPAWWMVEPGSAGSPELAGFDRPAEPTPSEQAVMLDRIGLQLIEEEA